MALSIAEMMLEEEPRPLESRTLYAYISASGATPFKIPFPAAVAATCVPCP